MPAISTTVAAARHSARLVWVTPNAENLVAYIAKVSNPAGQENSNYASLIRFLIKHKHWSPFEMASMCVEIDTTRAISPQILRHRSFSFQEFSQRYADVSALSNEREEYFTPRFEIRRQDLKNRQNSIDDIDEVLSGPERTEIDVANEIAETACLKAYELMLERGVAKECARNVLPMCTPTRLYMTGTLRSWIHYIQLRSANGTQKEHAMIAEHVRDILKAEVPIIYEAAFN